MFVIIEVGRSVLSYLYPPLLPGSSSTCLMLRGLSYLYRADFFVGGEGDGRSCCPRGSQQSVAGRDRRATTGCSQVRYHQLPCKHIFTFYTVLLVLVVEPRVRLWPAALPALSWTNSRTTAQVVPSKIFHEKKLLESSYGIGKLFQNDDDNGDYLTVSMNENCDNPPLPGVRERDENSWKLKGAIEKPCNPEITKRMQ